MSEPSPSPASRRRGRQFASTVQGRIPLETLISGEFEGERILPSALERQTALCDLVIDVAAEACVMQMLMRGKKATALLNSGFVKPPSDMTRDEARNHLNALLGKVPPDISGREKGELYFSALQKMKDAGWLVNSTNLCTPEELNRNREFLEDFASRWDHYAQRMRQWRHGGVVKETAPIPPNQEDTRYAIPPEDANVAAFNALEGNISLKENGPKGRISAMRKLTDMNAKLEGGDFIASSLKDMNRIKVELAGPEMETIFTELMARRMRQGPIGGAYKGKNMEAGPWKLQNSGFLDRKMMLVFGREGGRGMELGIKGALGEVMLTSPQLSIAHVISHYVYEVIRKMEIDDAFGRKGELNIRQFFPNEKDSTSTCHYKEMARDELFETYQEARNGFDQRAEALDLQLRFPVFEREQFESQGGMETALDALIAFHQELFVNLIGADSRDWQVHYLEQAFQAQAEVNREDIRERRPPSREYLPKKMIDNIIATMNPPLDPAFVSHLHDRATNAVRASVEREERAKQKPSR